jgi:hypothetical protein
VLHAFPRRPEWTARTATAERSFGPAVLNDAATRRRSGSAVRNASTHKRPLEWTSAHSAKNSQGVKHLVIDCSDPSSPPAGIRVVVEVGQRTAAAARRRRGGAACGTTFRSTASTRFSRADTKRDADRARLRARARYTTSRARAAQKRNPHSPESDRSPEGDPTRLVSASDMTLPPRGRRDA